MAGSGTGLAANVRRAGAQVSGAGVSERRAFATENPNRTVTWKTGSAPDMTTRLVLCLAVLLLAGACTTTGGGKDRSRHRTGPPKPPHHYAHKHDRLRNRMLLAAGVMNACGRHKRRPARDLERDRYQQAAEAARPLVRAPDRQGGAAEHRSPPSSGGPTAALRCRSFEAIRHGPPDRYDPFPAPLAVSPGPAARARNVQRPPGRSGSEARQAARSAIAATGIAPQGTRHP